MKKLKIILSLVKIIKNNYKEYKWTDSSECYGILNAKIKIVIPNNYSKEIKDLYKKIGELSQ